MTKEGKIKTKNIKHSLNGLKCLRKIAAYCTIQNFVGQLLFCKSISATFEGRLHTEQCANHLLKKDALIQQRKP